MKKIILASACVLALSAGGALAQQAQPAPGASSQGNVGPGATPHATTHPSKKGMTTGAGGGSSRAASPSSQGNVGPGTNNNMGKQPGGR
ncbi:hypothetical protein [Bradyrhizobium sp. Ai1a-2]|uniref:hypothetical protein n=1 Tax=Bradyrhizobium sp. Ai1a-2 TaxID=196490 RepID=UPI0003FBD03C|nr:hypothetical protein [Bradyrhizobium sp. Ai1a-2]